MSAAVCGVGVLAPGNNRASMLCGPHCRVCAGPLAWRGRLECRAGVGEGELGQQHGDVVVEPAPGVRAQPVQQFVGGCLQVGSAQRLDLLVYPEEPARPVPGL